MGYASWNGSMDGFPSLITGGMQAADTLLKKITSLMKTVKPIMALAAKAKF